MKPSRSLVMCLVFMPLLAAGCGGRAKSEAAAPVKYLDSWGMANVRAACSGKKLTVTGKYSTSGREGAMLLIVDGREGARVTLKEEQGVPFTLECTGLEPGQHEWELWFDGTVLAEMPGGEQVKHPSRWRVRPFASKVTCN